MVARRQVAEVYGVRPHINRIARCVREGYDSIFVVGWGENNIERVLDIKREVERNLLTVLRRYDLRRSNKIWSVILVCQSSASYLAQQAALTREIRQALYDVVPEFETGFCEIVDVARIRDVGSKIAVRSSQEQDAFAAVKACIGENGERHQALKQRFQDEFIGIVPWSSNPKEFIVNSLTPLKRNHVDSVTLDEDTLSADVRITTEAQLAKALGRNGSNVKLASQLTGWFISVAMPENSDSVKELQAVLYDKIPEVREGQIEIVAIARIRGIATKVLVRPREEKDFQPFWASQTCRGESYERAKAIQGEIGSEGLYFHEWSQDRVELVSRCLYPIERSEIESLQFHPVKREATLRLRPPVLDMPRGRDEYNLELATRVTGYRIQMADEAQGIEDLDSWLPRYGR